MCTEMQERWMTYQKTRGDGSLLDLREFAEVGGMCINYMDVVVFPMLCLEPFWIDLALYNPLEAEMNLTGLTLEAECSDALNGTPSESVVLIETIESVSLNGREKTTVSFLLGFLMIVADLASLDSHQSYSINADIPEIHPCSLFIPFPSTNQRKPRDTWETSK